MLARMSTLKPKRTGAELKELRALTGSDRGAQRVVSQYREVETCVCDSRKELVMYLVVPLSLGAATTLLQFTPATLFGLC